MAIDYEALLTPEQKQNILTQRISQFAAEAYQHTLNKTTAEAIKNEEGIKAADEALAVLDLAIKTHQDELAKLEGAE